jgi:subtilisin family serine protease
MPRPTPDKLQALERERLRLRGTPYLSGAPPGDAAPQRATDTVIVKVRSSRGAARRIAVAARSIEIEGLGRDAPWLARLIENNLAERVTPVFRAAPVERAARGALQAMAEAVREAQPVRAARGLVSIKVAPGVNANRLADHLNRQQDEFEYAYVPAIKYPCVARGSKRARKPRKTNDTLTDRQWAHAAIKIQQARARASFREADDIVVAVLDSGIDKTHPDLVDAIDSYLNFLPNEDDRDYKGHGTHVAGIIAAEMNNGIGIAGVCAARLMALKALPKRGNRWNAEAYYQALAHPIEAGVRVLNMSLGGGFDPGERDIIADLLDAGVTVVAAMGNEYEEGNPTSYPAAYPGVIAVGASDEMDRRAAFSCTGAHIALVAPGERIISTTPMYPSEFAAQVGYDSWPGTSMATPHVAAAAALLLAKHPRMTPAQIRERLMSTADRTPSQQGAFDEAYGAGRLDIAGALR